jgi:hypothetical protein
LLGGVVHFEEGQPAEYARDGQNEKLPIQLQVAAVEEAPAGGARLKRGSLKKGNFEN